MVDYPTYMMNVHEFLLDGTTDAGGAVETGGILLQIKTAIGTGGNPYTSLTAYNPTTDIASMATAIATFEATVTALNNHTDFDTIYGQAADAVDAEILPDTYINARMIAHATALDNEINTKVIPRFNAGMRDINAVQTSAFVIGRAIIELDRNDKVDKFAADMRYQADAKRGDMIQAAAAEMIRLFLQKAEFQRVIAALTIDQLRIAIAAQTDYKTETKAIAADLKRWPLEVYKYGANMLAGVGGGVTSSVPMDGNKTARIIGSGLSGAVAGAMVGGQIGGNEGAGYGALLGGLAGLIGGS